MLGSKRKNDAVSLSIKYQTGLYQCGLHNGRIMRNPIHHPRYHLFREMLMEARTASGLVQTEVAERLGKPQNFISKYERGERRLDFTEFLEVADVLGLDVTEFIKRYRTALKKATR
jgi:hypothetical protein